MITIDEINEGNKKYGKWIAIRTVLTMMTLLPIAFFSIKLYLFLGVIVGVLHFAWLMTFYLIIWELFFDYRKREAQESTPPFSEASQIPEGDENDR